MFWGKTGTRLITVDNGCNYRADLCCRVDREAKRYKPLDEVCIFVVNKDSSLFSLQVSEFKLQLCSLFGEGMFSRILIFPVSERVSFSLKNKFIITDRNTIGSQS